MFICHGNICRSPMAEFIMKKIVKDNNKENDYYIESSAMTYEEIGNDIYYLAKETLDKYNIPYSKRCAKIFKKSDYDNFDYIIIMDEENKKDISYINDYENKIYKLLYFIGSDSDVSDPWYTRKFDVCFKDIYDGCLGLFKFIEEK